MPRAATEPAVERTDASPKTHGLVVEGNPGDLIVYCEMLEQLGCKVLACTTPEEAVSCLKDQAFDFVVVNQGSRAFEGRSVVEQAMKTNPRARVLVSTRCVDMECYLEAMQLGAVDYVEKPLKALDLRRAAGRGLASCREAA